MVNCYKESVTGITSLEQVMKVMERVIAQLIRNKIRLDKMQFGFVLGRSIANAIVIARQLQEKYLAKNKPLYLACMDLEKAFNRLLCCEIWWALRKLGVDKWLVKVVQAMYRSSVRKVRINHEYCDEFSVHVGVLQNLVLSPFPFIIVLLAIIEEFMAGYPWDLSYADDVALIADFVTEREKKFQAWKQNLESKGIKVNLAKTKALVSKKSDRTLPISGHLPEVGRKSVNRNSIVYPVQTMDTQKVQWNNRNVNRGSFCMWKMHRSHEVYRYPRNPLSILSSVNLR
eukprot:XP_014789569.1 PREDICTED: uncharacterized protein LOC106883166 [Octopus bimaculoides]